MSKVIYATIRIVLSDDAEIEDVVSESSYEFDHPDIEDTEWVDVSNIYEEGDS